MPRAAASSRWRAARRWPLAGLAAAPRRARPTTASIAHVERDRRRPADPGLRARRTPTVDLDDVDGHHRRRRRPRPTAALGRRRPRRSGAPRSWRSTPATRWPAQRFEAAKAAAHDLPRHRPRRRLRRHRHLRRRRRRRRSTPTQDRDAARAVIDGLDARPSRPASTTACSAAVDMAGDRGPAQRPGALRRRGHQRHRRSTDVTDAIEDAEVQVDVVALEQTGAAARAPLRATGRRRRAAR